MLKYFLRFNTNNESLAVSFIWHDMPTPRSIDIEVSRWFNMWFRQSDTVDLPDTLMKSLVSADPDSFPKL